VTDTGGDPACWADRVCPACGMLDERAAGDRDETCPHCGEPYDAHRADARQASPADDGPRHEHRSTTTPERELTDEDYSRLLELRDGLRRFVHWSEQQARNAGITPAQHQLLLAVRGHPGGSPTLGDISDHLLLRHHSAVGLVDRAVAAGLLVRCGDPDDLRVVRVELTDRGAAVLAALTAEHKEELERIGLDYRNLGTNLPPT